MVWKPESFLVWLEENGFLLFISVDPEKARLRGLSTLDLGR